MVAVPAQVPPLLGAFYSTVGMLQLFLDERVSPAAAAAGGSKATGSPQKTAASLVFVHVHAVCTSSPPLMIRFSGD